MRTLTVFAVTACLSLVVGCSAQPKKLQMLVKDPVSGEFLEAYASATTVKDSSDRSITFDQLGVKDVDEKTGKERLRAIGTQRTVGGTTVGRSIEGVTSGMGAAGVQGYFIDKASKRKADAYAEAYKCPEGAVLCHSTYLEGAQSFSNAEGVGNATAGSSTTIGCDTGNCAAPPTH